MLWLGVVGNLINPDLIRDRFQHVQMMGWAYFDFDETRLQPQYSDPESQRIPRTRKSRSLTHIQVADSQMFPPIQSLFYLPSGPAWSSKECECMYVGSWSFDRVASFGAFGTRV